MAAISVGKELQIYASGDRGKPTGVSRLSFLKSRVDLFTQLLGIWLKLINPDEVIVDAIRLFAHGADYAQSGNESVKATAGETRRVLTPDADSEKFCTMTPLWMKRSRTTPSGLLLNP